MSEAAVGQKSSPLRIVAAGVLGLGVFLGMVFAPAGRLDWGRGWLYVGLLLGGWWVNQVLLARSNPELAKRRQAANEGTPGEGTPNWDKLLQHFVRLSVLAAFVLSGLDAVRFGWAPLPAWALFLGLGLQVGGHAVVIWAMLVNAHFEGYVRIQEDRDHRVCAEGPYSIVRHPGYVGMSLMLVAIPCLLGSLWGLLPAGLCVGLLLIRTALEDRFLRAHLDGYQDYARRVRGRLIPWLW